MISISHKWYDVKLIFIFLSICCLCFKAQSQITEENAWYYKDYDSDTVYGISLFKTYQFIKAHQLKPNNKIIIASLDNGVDTSHALLKPHLWRNLKEIIGNGKDDDKNGYIDDIYGWNFLGNSDGKNLNTSSSERFRVYWKYYDKFSNIDSKNISSKDLNQYLLWKTTKPTDSELEDVISKLNYIKISLEVLSKSFEIIQPFMDTSIFTMEDVENMKPVRGVVLERKMILLRMINILRIEKKQTNVNIIKELKEEIQSKEYELSSLTKPIKNYRQEVLYDDYDNFKNTQYGNNNITIFNPVHGTHVTGICLSIPLQKWNVQKEYPLIKLMTLRVVPIGDEYDKDVALGILYAVNNGAKIINMSFGKSYSPEQFLVDSAIKYAGRKNVLIVHAGGNSRKNLSLYPNYPTPYKRLADTVGLPYFITVGASSDEKLFDSVQTNFSNYGKYKIDIMAPGNSIYSSIPFQDKYEIFSGTSMASPIVAHVAALIWSYFPKLTAIEIKKIIMKSAFIPKGHEFDNKCNSKGIINAYKAFTLAYQINKNKK